MAQHTISTEDVRRIGRVVADFEGRPVNSLPRLERVVRIEGSGGGGSCTQAIRILVMGFPSSGSLTIPISHTTLGSGDLVIPMPSTVAAISTLIDGHPVLGGHGLVVTPAIGSLPYIEIAIVNGGTSIDFDDVGIGDWTSTMTGGAHAAYAVISRCCG